MHSPRAVAAGIGNDGSTFAEACCKDLNGFADLVLVDVAQYVVGSLRSNLIVFSDTCRPSGRVAATAGDVRCLLDGTIIDWFDPTA